MQFTKSKFISHKFNNEIIFSFLRILGFDLQSNKNSNVNETLVYIPSMYILESAFKKKF